MLQVARHKEQAIWDSSTPIYQLPSKSQSSYCRRFHIVALDDIRWVRMLNMVRIIRNTIQFFVCQHPIIRDERSIGVDDMDDLRKILPCVRVLPLNLIEHERAHGLFHVTAHDKSPRRLGKHRNRRHITIESLTFNADLLLEILRERGDHRILFARTLDKEQDDLLSPTISISPSPVQAAHQTRAHPDGPPDRMPSRSLDGQSAHKRFRPGLPS